MTKRQDQDTSDGSTAIQAGGNVTVTTQGLSYSEVRQAALDVFRANFYQLVGQAKEAAQARAEEITESFLSKLQTENPEGLEKAEDPDFQHALFTVQKEYARTGDKDLGDLLVDLLVDRSKEDQRDILQIVLNESLNTAPKLTDNQLALLAIIFLFRYTQNHGIGTQAQFSGFLDAHVGPFAERIVSNQAAFQHLEFSGCGSISMASVKLEKILATNYRGLFVKGFEREEFEKREIDSQLQSKWLVRCLNDPQRWQVNALHENSLNDVMAKEGVTEEAQKSILELFRLNEMTEAEIRDKCTEMRPYMSVVFDVWSNSPMKNFTLTSVGIAIGHANIKRLRGEFADLRIWIN